MSKTIIIARTRPDGSVISVGADGKERLLPHDGLRDMTAEQVGRAAAADPDALPMTRAQLHTAQHLPRIRVLRRALGLTQEEFALRYRIPLGTLRDWEQGRTEPDQPARAYLTVIANDPEGVWRNLQSGQAKI